MVECMAHSFGAHKQRVYKSFERLVDVFPVGSGARAPWVRVRLFGRAHRFGPLRSIPQSKRQEEQKSADIPVVR